MKENLAFAIFDTQLIYQNLMAGDVSYLQNDLRFLKDRIETLNDETLTCTLGLIINLAVHYKTGLDVGLTDEKIKHIKKPLSRLYMLMIFKGNFKETPAPYKVWLDMTSF